MLISLMLVMVPSVEALQRPAKQQTGVVNAANPATSVPINPDVIALQTSSDLIVKELGFNARGDLTFELWNRGEVPVNPGGPVSLAGGASRAAIPPVPENQQIKVNVYLNNAAIGTVFQPRLAGKTSKIFTVTVPETARPRCGQTRPLKTVIDPSNVIVELTDTNNVDTVTAARPCPDLAVESIKKNFNDLKTHYAARITIINKGNAPVERFEYWAKENFGGHLADLGGQADESTGPLAPGQTFKFNIGFVPAYDNMQITVMLDRSGLVEELDESNNYVEKHLN
ncbi:MAG: CARDB domain-containing protein [Gemmatimonadales bacterium]